MDRIIIHLSRNDEDEFKRILNSYQIKYSYHVEMAFDSATPLDWLELSINGLTSKQAFAAYDAAIGYFLGRNRNKKLVIVYKDGSKIEISGFNKTDINEIFSEVNKCYLDDKKPT